MLTWFRLHVSDMISDTRLSAILVKTNLSYSRKNSGLRDGFEGNAQSFRIVTKLAFRSLEHPGLDLTRATLAAFLKYPWLKANKGMKSKKWGAYDSRRTRFRLGMRTIV